MQGLLRRSMMFTFGRWPDCSIIQSRSPRPRITRAEDSGKTIKLTEEEKKKP